MKILEGAQKKSGERVQWVEMGTEKISSSWSSDIHIYTTAHEDMEIHTHVHTHTNKYLYKLNFKI